MALRAPLIKLGKAMKKPVVGIFKQAGKKVAEKGISTRQVML